MSASMSRSLRMYRAMTIFFFPDARVIGAGGGVVLAGLARGVPVGVVAELGEHPGAEDRSQAGLGQVDLSVRVPAKMRLHLPLQGLDLLVEGGDHRDQGPDRGGVGGGDGGRLAQLRAAQRRLDRRGLAGDVAAAGALERRGDLRAGQPGAPGPGPAPWPAVPACRARPGPRRPPARRGSTPAARAAAAGPAGSVPRSASYGSGPPP